MPRNREGVKVLFVELPEELLCRLQAVAKVSHRSVTGQTTVAIEEHLTKYETDASRKLASELAEAEEREELEERRESSTDFAKPAGKKPAGGKLQAAVAE